MMKRIPWYVYVLIVLFAIGLVAPDDQEPTITEPEPPTATLAATERPVRVDSACYEEYTGIAIQTIVRIPEAGTLAVIDALMQSYDSVARRLPYDCGNRELLDDADIAVRLALGNARSYIETGSTDFDVATGLHIQQARAALEQLGVQP